jgi:hypothetical protein
LLNLLAFGMSAVIGRRVQTIHRIKTNGWVAGVVGGVVAAWTMTQCGTWRVRLAQTPNRGTAEVPPVGPVTQDDRATAVFIRAAAHRVLKRRLTPSQLCRAIPIVRYGYGAVAGVAYGLLVDRVGGGVAAGAAWGTALWIVGDRIALPAVAGPDNGQAEHAQAFTCHLVYGLTTEAVRRFVRSLL